MEYEFFAGCLSDHCGLPVKVLPKAKDEKKQAVVLRRSDFGCISVCICFPYSLLLS